MQTNTPTDIMTTDLILIYGDRAETLLAARESVTEVAESLASQGETTVRPHLDAIRAADELMWAHESDNPADELLHYFAEQLMLWHLEQLYGILARR